MGKEDFTCDFCGDRIPSSDFEKGRAAILLKKTYCEKCVAEAIRKSKEAPSDRKHDSSPSRLIGSPS